MAGRAELLTAVGGLVALTLAAAAALRFATTAAARRAFGGEGRVRWELVALRAALSFAIRTCTYLGRDVAWDGERFELKGTGEVRRRRGRRRRDRAPDVAPSPVGAGRLESPFARRLGGVRVSTEPGQVKRVLVADSRTRCRARDISHAPR